MPSSSSWNSLLHWMGWVMEPVAVTAPNGGVGVVGVDVAVGGEHFAYVLGVVKAVGAPGSVLLDGQRARGYSLRGGPCGRSCNAPW